MSEKPERSPTASTVAGIGAGTGLLGIANSIPDSYPFLKHAAIYAAPTATVLVRWAWLLLSFWITGLITKKTADYGLEKMRALRDEALNDAHATQEHKQEMQEQCEKMERIAAESISKGVKSVHEQFGSGLSD